MDNLNYFTYKFMNYGTYEATGNLSTDQTYNIKKLFDIIIYHGYVKESLLYKDTY